MKDTIRDTTVKVADILTSCADIQDLDRVLEPSAGYGNIADRILRHCELYGLDVQLKCIELNQKRVEVLESKGYDVDRRDFLNYSPRESYNRIIANPNFLRGVDVGHIKHMFFLLKPGGKLVSTFSPHRLSENDNVGREFRRWISDKEYYVFMLPPNSYRENGEDRPTSVIVMENEEF